MVVFVESDRPGGRNLGEQRLKIEDLGIERALESWPDSITRTRRCEAA